MKKTKDRQLDEFVNNFLPIISSDKTFDLVTKEERKGYILLEFHLNVNFNIEWPEKFAVLDIETQGLSRNESIFIAGILEHINYQSVIRQYCAYTESREKGLIKWVNGQIKGKTIITYNGKAFDFPFLTSRAEYHNIPFELPPKHIDVLHMTRRAFKDTFNSRKLKILEFNVLDQWREIDINPAFIPYLIKKYRQTRDFSLLLILSRHNAYDLLSTLKIFEKAYEMLSPSS